MPSSPQIIGILFSFCDHCHGCHTRCNHVISRCINNIYFSDHRFYNRLDFILSLRRYNLLLPVLPPCMLLLPYLPASTEFDSAEQYRTPTVFASGISFSEDRSAPLPESYQKYQLHFRPVHRLTLPDQILPDLLRLSAGSEYLR